MPSLVYRERNGVPLNNQAKVKEEASFARTGSLLNKVGRMGSEFVRGAGFGFRSFFVNKQSGEGATRSEAVPANSYMFMVQTLTTICRTHPRTSTKAMCPTSIMPLD
jgi:hypothetical protein